jgi:hypothetical protein
MAYACFYDVPGNEAMYERVKTAIGEDRPEGLVLHLVVQSDIGLRHFGVWESKQQWERFQQERVAPAVRQVLAAAGVAEPPPPPAIHELELVDVTTA